LFFPSSDSEEPVVIETDHETGGVETSQAVASTEPETSEAVTSIEPAPSANWFESLDKETRQQMAETKKMEGNELFGKACFQLACKKYAEVILKTGKTIFFSSKMAAPYNKIYALPSYCTT
jgi:hypothetical protein